MGDHQAKPVIRGAGRWLSLLLVSSLAGATASGQDKEHPLQPPDRSSPRATLRTFLDSTDTLAAFVAQQYIPSPTLGEFNHMFLLAQTPVGCLDLSEVAPSARRKTAGAAALALYETLTRIELPRWDEIPGTDQTGQSAGTDLSRWVIPRTEITLVRMQGGSHPGEFLFSADTVARASAFYERVRDLPQIRPVPLRGMSEILTQGCGWPMRLSWIQAMPAWLRTPLGGQSVWKWIALALVVGLFSMALRLVYRLSLRGSGERPFLQALMRLALPMFVVAATPC